VSTDPLPSGTNRKTVSSRLVRAAIFGVGLSFILLCCCGPFLITIVDCGSPELALLWKAKLEPLGDLDSARQAVPAIPGRRFDNGEWAFGFCQDSHRQLRFTSSGGTLVVKDSRGAVRAFFGHVCGPQFLQDQLDRAKSLDDFYDRCLPEWKFVEYTGL
jgi:hypothetical protein